MVGSSEMADYLAMAERHVRLGEEHVHKQQRIVERLRAGGHDTRMAEQLLAEFEQTLVDHRAHRDRLAEELRKTAH